jgi:hypothetical protein
MHKWIQRAEKALGHSDYTNSATQICRSNHSSPDLGKNQTEKITGKEPKGRTFRLHFKTRGKIP